MPQLNINQTALGEDQFRVELSSDFSNLRPQVTFNYRLSDDDAKNLRWYMEEYLEYPHDPEPQIAARIEQRMVELGNELFAKIFDGNTDVQRFWAKLPEDLHRLRVEISTSVREAAAIPWELLRDPHLDVPLALRAQAFVRSHPQAKMEALKLSDTEEKIRILLVICRPAGGNDVPFRSVASRLVKGLGQNSQAQLDVLRPPTFEQLGKVLRQAKQAGKAYHIVHFDGHGMYEDAKLVATLMPSEFSRVKLDAGRTGKHGYLAFENARLSNNMQPVDGKSLGDLLVETQVPVLVLNACRSAHAEASEMPPDEDGNPHEQIRAFGSLAQEVMDCGVAGVARPLFSENK